MPLPAQIFTAKGRGGEFAIIAPIGWAFSLTMPADCFPLATQTAGEDTLPEERPGKRAILGVAIRKFFAKLNGRKHVAAGSRIVRACIGETHSQDSFGPHIPEPLRPLCTLWPAIVRIAWAGARLFPLWNSQKVLRELRSIGGCKGSKSAGIMGTHSLIGGAARAMLVAGGSFA